MLPSNANSLREVLESSSESSFLWGTKYNVCLRDLYRGSYLDGSLSELSGRSVLLAIRDQFVGALALIELDGAVRRLILCPPDLTSEQLASVAADADADAIVTECSEPQVNSINCIHVAYQPKSIRSTSERAQYSTEWVLLTSGTTTAPKLVLHSMRSLTSAIPSSDKQGTSITWSTFYDIRRYGGLQILLRALLGNASLVLSGRDEPLGDFLGRLMQHSVTHILGTPTHWLRALMSPAARKIMPRYVRLSGEIADQSILNALRSFYPNAAIAHAFASTEAGVLFAVNDGMEGFPASLLHESGRGVELKIENGSLHVRSAGTAVRYLGSDSELRDNQGFVDTRDIVELRNGRYYFLGRTSGVINVGGQKVHPEEVEAVINRHPEVQMSLVRGRKNPIIGSIVVADVILKEDAQQNVSFSRDVALKSEILGICREALAKHKIPTAINIVANLKIAATGKLIRQ